MFIEYCVDHGCDCDDRRGVILGAATTLREAQQAARYDLLVYERHGEIVTIWDRVGSEWRERVLWRNRYQDRPVAGETGR